MSSNLTMNFSFNAVLINTGVIMKYSGCDLFQMMFL